MPRGPTVTFKVSDYSLAADIFDYNSNLVNEANEANNYKLSSRIIPKPLTKSFNHVPLVIMNGFNSNKVSAEYVEPLKVASMLIQSFFPPLNLNEIQLKTCKRVVLFNLSFDAVTNEPIIEFRHYDIDIEKYSIKKTISNILNNKKTDLSKFENIADYILKQSGFTSCSDNEDPNLGVVDIIQDEENKTEKITKEEKENKDQIKVKLYEIGPRINLKIHKIEEGFFKRECCFSCLYEKIAKRY